MSDPITLVRWEPWELDGHDCWRCSIRTGHGELSWTTRYPPGDDPLTVGDLRDIIDLAEIGLDTMLDAGTIDEADEDEERATIARVRAALGEEP